MKYIIEANNVTKKYYRKFKGMKIPALEKGAEEYVATALNNVSLNISEGEFVVLMGPSGAGKSTFLNMISTIDVQSSGTVKIHGENIKKMSEDDISKFRYENLGFIFQNFNVLSNLTVKENIVLPLTLANISIEEVNDRANMISKKLNIEDILDKYPDECSGGQVQRVSAARALINNPDIIIADEPTGNLDTVNSHELLSFLKELNEKEGKTIVMVTHDPMIASYGKRIIYIRDGVIEKELLKKSKNQNEFYYDIIDYVSKESRNLFEKIIK
ncbi:ABC transporter ATP-binding protein [Clostridium sp.]|uniref:ABC transporter ATP-binding protein n=1 Tax=Clostridium sp. TaxID=1506 RepID=UPI002FC7B9A5